MSDLPLSPPQGQPADPPRYTIEGRMLCEYVEHCTCGTGPGGYYGAHEPGCGLEMLLPMEDVIAALDARPVSPVPAPTGERDPEREGGFDWARVALNTARRGGAREAQLSEALRAMARRLTQERRCSRAEHTRYDAYYRMLNHAPIEAIAAWKQRLVQAWQDGGGAPILTAELVTAYIKAHGSPASPPVVSEPSAEPRVAAETYGVRGCTCPHPPKMHRATGGCIGLNTQAQAYPGLLRCPCNGVKLISKNVAELPSVSDDPAEDDEDTRTEAQRNCTNCDGRLCMDCCSRVMHAECVDDCPVCCAADPAEDERCGACGGNRIEPQAFSGGREYYCHDCDDSHAYDRPAAPAVPAPTEPENLEHWFVIRMSTHERLREFRNYDDALRFARTKWEREGVQVQVMTGYNLPDVAESRAAGEDSEPLLTGNAAEDAYRAVIVALTRERDKARAERDRYFRRANFAEAHTCPAPDWYPKVRRLLADISLAAAYTGTDLEKLPEHVGRLRAELADIRAAWDKALDTAEKFLDQRDEATDILRALSGNHYGAGDLNVNEDLMARARAWLTRREAGNG